MGPSSASHLDVLWAEANLAETKYMTADLLVRGFIALFGLAALANLGCFVFVEPHRLLVAGTLFSALTALSVWAIGMRRVEALQQQLHGRERAIDEYLGLPVS